MIPLNLAMFQKLHSSRQKKLTMDNVLPETKGTFCSPTKTRNFWLVLQAQENARINYLQQILYVPFIYLQTYERKKDPSSIYAPAAECTIVNSFIICYASFKYSTKYCVHLITFGGIMQILYGAKLRGHLISKSVDKISMAVAMIRVNPRPQQPITKNSFLLWEFTNVA